jgi:hypothetical protein
MSRYYRSFLEESVITPSYPSSLKLFIDAGNPLSYSGSGTIVTDLIGTQNGTLTNGVGYSSSNGGYFTFDGVNDYIDFGINNLIRTTSARTISLWININSGIGNFFSDCNALGYQGVELWLDAGGFRSVVIGTATYQVAVNNTTTSYNTWYYMTLSWNGTTLKAYWNGVLNASPAQTVIPINNTTTSTKLGLSNEAGGRIPLNGKIAQCKIYNVQLSDAEILTDFNEFKSRYGY